MVPRREADHFLPFRRLVGSSIRVYRDFLDSLRKKILQSSHVRSSTKFAYIAIWKFGLVLAVAVMFADGPLVLLIRHDVGVREVRRALHALLVHP